MNLAENTKELQQGLDQEVLLHRMTNRIRQSLELQEILTAAVAEIRSFLGTDRVMVYRFHADSSGEVIAESIRENRLPSLLGLNFPADDIPQIARDLILKTRQRSIISVPNQEIGSSILDDPETGEPLKTIEIKYRSADPCHIQYLTAMGVQFSLSVPILHQRKMWGLLVSHDTENRTVSERELQLVQRVADQVSIAIAQSNLLSQARAQAQREATINKISALLHAQPEIELQAALEEMVTVLQGSGGRLYIKVNQIEGEKNGSHPDSQINLYTCGAQPILAEPLESHPFWQEWTERCLRSTQTAIHSDSNSCENDNLCCITDLYKETYLQILAPAFQSTKIRGLMIIPLQYRQVSLGYLTIFRDEINTETLWAGQFDTDKRQIRPRKSFEAWRELKSGQAWQWTSNDLELAHALSHHFGMATQQYQLYQQVQALNTNLERQVEERTAQLQKSLDLAQVLKQVTDQIRSTLEFKTILQTIVREVRNLLNTDRAVIYQFVRDWDGEVVVEAVTDNWISLLGKMISDDCFSGEHAHLYEEGRFRAIDNVLESDLSDCHKEFLHRIQVQANLVVPIRIGGKLWGLLIAHECGQTRVWQAAEIDLLQQLADEAAIAIHQAALYEQSCAAAATATAQAEQLEQAAEQQKALFGVITKIRETLDLSRIFQGAAREIRQLLDADRVGVFRFLPDSNWQEGEFVSENVLPGFTSISGIKVRENCFAEKHAAEYCQGRIRVINDIYNSSLSDCHIQFLDRLQVRASIVVPLIEGDDLWGLLCIHQCKHPRQWSDSEVEFVIQIATQLGVALQQAELLAKTQEQTEQLTRAIRELQQTQTQLIQTEKMSSLGQLVAGIAHEINNPVNFIYGNLSHASQYAQDLLEHLEMYQKHYSQRHPEIVDHEEEIELDFLTADLPKILTSMKVGAERIRQMVLSLRNFSRLDQSEKKAVNLHEGIDSTLLILQHRLKMKTNSPGIQVIKEYSDLPLINCYPGPLNQVFMNVLSNAIDALDQRDAQRSLEEITDSPSQIIISTALISDKSDHRQSGTEKAIIKITDNGTGIPQEVINQIFNPFFTTKPVGKGTGLGLSISYQIVVEKHGGEFRCNSLPGKGTEFWIEIPIK